jgi:hypothetical protein
MALLKTTVGPTFEVQISKKAVSHAKYFAGLIEVTEDELPAMEVAEADRKTLEIIASFLEAHSDDPDVPEDWKEKPVTPLTPADEALFKDLTGPEYVRLFKASNFLESKLMLNAACQAGARIMSGKSEEEVQDWFGKRRTFTEAEINSVKAKYPTLFK